MYTYMYIQYMYNTQGVQNSTESLTHMHTHALCPTHLFIFKQPHEYTHTHALCTTYDTPMFVFKQPPTPSTPLVAVSPLT